MILIKVRRKGSLITDLEISGHAGYSVRGSDIVCASVSAIAQTALAGIDEIAKIQDSYKIEKAGKITLSLPDDISQEQRDKAGVILETMMLGLHEVEAQFGRFVKIECN